MEKKLTGYAELLPTSAMDFQDVVENSAKYPRKRKTRWRLSIAAAIMAMMCLATTVFAYTGLRYGLWSGLHSKGFGDVKLLSWEYDYAFPETLGGSPFESVSVLYGAPEGAGHLEALLQPTYKLCSIHYAVERQEERYEVDENTKVETWITEVWTERNISVSFGTAKNENWKYHFSVSEDGSCDYEDIIPGSQYSMVYEGYILHCYSIGEIDSVRWEDLERQLVLDVSCKKGELDVLAVAKELIDLNR